MHTLLLSIHPFFQCIGILLACYGAFLGLQRASSLHFGQQGSRFQRQRHAAVGAIALFLLLGGMVGGTIMADLVWHGTVAIQRHKTMAMALLPLLLIGIVTGLYLYFKPGKRTVLPAIHGLNNGILFVLLLVQAYSGIRIYLAHVLKVH